MHHLRTILAALILAASAEAHDLWLDQGAGGYMLLYGHRHSAHAGQDRVEYRPEAVRRLSCFGADGQAVGEGTTAAYPARLAGDCAAAYALLATGHWTKTPYGTKNLPKDQVGGAIASWVSFEGVKRIDGWGQGLSRPLTQDLELVPLENPLTLNEGAKIRLRVTLAGQPVAGAVVAYEGEPRGETGPDGLMNIRLRHGGLQRIEATLRRPLHGPKADEEIHTTTLSFALGGHR